MTLLKDAGVPTPKFGVANTAAEAKTIAEELGGSDLVIKAQVSVNLGLITSIQIAWNIRSTLLLCSNRTFLTICYF